ncbi:MAG: DNA methyltransferase [Verrucomicrobiota bacterium]
MNKFRTILGDCFEELEKLPDNSIDAVCTDPPYGIVEFSENEVAKLRSGKGGIWRLPPKFDGKERRPLPRFSILTTEQKIDIEKFFTRFARAIEPKLKPGGHMLIAGNPVLQLNVQTGVASSGFENRATILRLYHGFRGGDRPKNAESEFPEVCVTPRGNYEPWMLFRKPISERTVAANLRRWGTGGLRMLCGGRPLPDVIPSFKTPAREKEIANHPSLKPQHLLRIFVRSLLPTGSGMVLDPFMGSGSTLAACLAVGCQSIGIERDLEYFSLAESSIPRLAALYPRFTGDTLESDELNGSTQELKEQLRLLETPSKYGKR